MSDAAALLRRFAGKRRAFYSAGITAFTCTALLRMRGSFACCHTMRARGFLLARRLAWKTGAFLCCALRVMLGSSFTAALGADVACLLLLGAQIQLDFTRLFTLPVVVWKQGCCGSYGIQTVTNCGAATDGRTMLRIFLFFPTTTFKGKVDGAAPAFSSRWAPFANCAAVRRTILPRTGRNILLGTARDTSLLFSHPTTSTEMEGLNVLWVTKQMNIPFTSSTDIALSAFTTVSLLVQLPEKRIGVS